MPNPDIYSFLTLMNNFDNQVVDWNKEYIARELEINKEFFDNIDGKSLDSQQRVAVLTDEDSNLVLAGAGSGKTLVLSGKAKFLTEKRGISPDQILLISFTNKAAEEMYERIAERLNVKVNVRTFHKLGSEIIAKYTGKKSSVVDDMTQIIQKYFRSAVYSNPGEIEKIVTFFGMYLNIPKDLEQFSSLGEFYEEQKSLDTESLKGKLQKATKNLQTFKGETMKSIEETLIANFLFLNGIEYIYENDYEYPTVTEQKRQYKPDFYLSEYGIYIEHFGVSEDFRTPWLSSIDEEKYLKEIEWKRGKHKEKNTVLIESYSYYNKKGMLLEQLETNLREHGVQFKKIDVKSIYDALCIKANDISFQKFIDIIESFINLFKSSGYKKEKFSEFTKQNQVVFKHNTFLKMRNQIFFSLVEPVYEFYQDTLSKTNQIDFNDMINLATDIVRDKATAFNYKYIMIDEYQDISQSRYQLINAIKEKTNAKIICVGDDWQSIYRFAGSDIQLFTNFSDYFGKYELLRIERTYRNSQQLINIAGNFVMKNKRQFVKNLVSSKNNNDPIQVIGYTDNKAETLKMLLDNIIKRDGQEQKIMLLGRNKHDIKFLRDQTDFKLINVKEENIIILKYLKYESVEIKFMSVHRSKGLEADQVILLNAKNDLLGFPNRISDDPVLSWVLTGQDAYDFAEERRLFYVALTRTKNNMYILMPEKDPSIFVRELINDYKVNFETMYKNNNSIVNNPKCLKCKTGILVERNKRFIGCSNYPQCDQTYNDLTLLKTQVICDHCGGYMVRRKGRVQDFYGCTNFPTCSKSKSIEEVHKIVNIVG